MAVDSRRSFLKLGLKVSAVGIAAAALQACGSKPAADASACVDVGSLTSSEQSLRQSMNYAEKAPDATKSCSGCAFFTAGEGGASCGSCEIFTGGPANPGGHCDSWAAKPA